MNAGGRGKVACTADLHEQLLWQVRRGRSIDTAAALLGMSGRSVHRCARRDQLFREQLSQAIADRQGSTLPHGRTRYRQGCRCAICRGANACAARQHRERHQGDAAGRVVKHPLPDEQPICGHTDPPCPTIDSLEEARFWIRVLNRRSVRDSEHFVQLLTILEDDKRRSVHAWLAFLAASVFWLTVFIVVTATR